MQNTKKGNSEYLACAAIWFKDGQKHSFLPINLTEGFVVCGHRHHNCFATLAIFKDPREYLKYDHEFGFLTSENRFVDRDTAIKLAKGYLKNFETDKEYLNGVFSEDLY